MDTLPFLANMGRTQNSILFQHGEPQISNKLDIIIYDNITVIRNDKTSNCFGRHLHLFAPSSPYSRKWGEHEHTVKLFYDDSLDC